MREKLNDDLEKKIASLNSIGQLREKALKEPEIEDYVIDSIEPVKVLLYDVISRLKWKSKHLKSVRAATDDEITHLCKSIERIERVDLEKTTQKDLKAKVLLGSFISKHCKIRHYMFSVKKCGSSTCNVCKAPRVPAEIFETLHHLPDPEPSDGERYKPFEEVYRKPTSEKFRPSLKEKPSQKNGMPFSPSSQFAKNVEMVIICSQCEKSRVLYCKTVVRGKMRDQLKSSLADLEYSCGSTFQDIDCEDDHVLRKVFVKENIMCKDNIEFSYYSAGFEPICIYCGEDEEYSDSDFYPLCENCKTEKKQYIPRRKKMAANKKQ